MPETPAVVLEFRDMISNLTIKDFRAFRELRIDPLTRVNLFVGPNNAGKTTILEAVEILTLGTIKALEGILERRGEQLVKERSLEPDPAHLFHGHSKEIGQSFAIAGDELSMQCTVEERRLREDATDLPVRGLLLKAGEAKVFQMLSPSGGLVIQPLWHDRAQRGPNGSSSGPDAVSFLGTDPVDAYGLGHLWDRLVLTPEEESVPAALRIIEPRVERIAFLGENHPSMRTIFVKLAGEQRVPLGSLGDGLKRLLSLVLHLFSAKGGYLLVDEIDTGLHFSVMTDIWKLVIETANRLGVQIFATTHSLDCVNALAWVQERYPGLAAEVTLHRVQPNLKATVVYTMDEIAIAERGHIEVR
jgi:ABC-type branched-subunit amino acid transport system ATPase component